MDGITETEEDEALYFDVRRARVSLEVMMAECVLATWD